MDWLWQLAEDFAAEFEPRDLGLVGYIVLAAILIPLLTFVHEAGHALAALACRRRLIELRVGDEEPMFRFRIRGFRVLLGPTSEEAVVGGYLLHGGPPPGPLVILAIALAGPLASLAGAVATGYATVALPFSTFSVGLGIATLCGLIIVVENLRWSDDDPELWSDGQWAGHALRTLVGR